MKTKNLKDKIEQIFKTDDRFWDKEREVLLRNTISDSAEKNDEKLLEMLLSDQAAKEHFFKKIGKVIVFDKDKFLVYINNKDFLENSYTKFTQNIGLTDEGQFLKSSGKVVLNWPYKDCILEGGQTKEDIKRNEIFFNEILEKDEIDVLLKPKVFSKFKKYSRKNGKVKGENLEKFTRDKNGVIKDNLIVKGNNLIVLHSLKEEFAGKVKLIYIDPPYNTGNDGFKYNDNFNHSSWLTFMKNRLEVARDLLKNDGSIWINIDDGESHYLKILCDEIFGRENFIANVIWQKKYSPQNDAKYFSDNHDHILIFAKKKENWKINLLPRTEKMDERYKNPDNDLRGDWKTSDLSAKRVTPKDVYEIKTPSGRKVLPPQGRSWAVSKNKFQELLKDNRVWFGADGNSIPQLKRFISEVQEGFVPLTIWPYIEVGHNQEAKKEINALGFGDIFDTPKPERLLQRILQIGSNDDDIVLDFFAGSGTSGTVAHKTKRQYILVEQMDYIRKLPEARLKKVIEGEQGGISKAVNWKGGGEFIYMEMKEFNQEFLNAIKKTNKKEDLKKIYENIKEKAFLSYRFSDKKFEAKTSEFNNLDLKEQKQVLAELLDKNQLYLSHTEIEDETFKISKKDIDVNKSFYNKS